MICAPRQTPNTGLPEEMASAKNSRSAWMAGKSSLAESAPPRAMMRLISLRGGGLKSVKSGADS